jgi:hypothetical protein
MMIENFDTPAVAAGSLAKFESTVQTAKQRKSANSLVESATFVAAPAT